MAEVYRSEGWQPLTQDAAQSNGLRLGLEGIGARPINPADKCLAQDPSKLPDSLGEWVMAVSSQVSLPHEQQIRQDNGEQ